MISSIWKYTMTETDKSIEWKNLNANFYDFTADILITLRPEINEHQNYALLRNLPGKEKKRPALSKLSAPVRFLSALRALAPYKNMGTK